MAPSMADRLNRNSDTWQPEPDEYKEGTVVSVSEQISEYNPEPYPVVEFDEDDGTQWRFHAFHTVAKNEIARLKPQPGDRIGIKYFGEVKSKPGSKYDKYKKYNVVVDSANGDVPDAPNYDQMQSDAKDEGVDEFVPTTVDADGEPF